MSSVPVSLLDRDLKWFEIIRLFEKEFDLKRVSFNRGRLFKKNDSICCLLKDFPEEVCVQQIRISLKNKKKANGIGMRVRIQGWKKISYIAIGYIENGNFQHSKSHNPRQEYWFDFNIGFQDLAWGWSNSWNYPEERVVDNIQFYIKGVPSKQAFCDISEILIWNEEEDPKDVFGTNKNEISDKLVQSLFEYSREYFPHYLELGESYMREGYCPLDGKVLLEWPTSADRPLRLADNGTFQYSWHSLHPSMMLLLLAEASGDLAPVFAARELAVDWLTQSFDRPDPNIKYAWYDHGVAERLIVLIQLFAYGKKLKFDFRFMERLKKAIFRHGQILASEIFYVSHQSSRYHNHGWFQDLALLTTTLAFPEWKCADLWGEIALARLEDQFDHLIIHDAQYAVFIENSFGYHLGIERLVKKVGFLVSLSKRLSSAAEQANALSYFSDLMLYPDGNRGVAQGDTFRQANPSNRSDVTLATVWKSESVFLPKAGYIVIKGGGIENPWLISLFATNKNITHKHEDDLSFVFWMDGVEWFIDPSFYSHEYNSKIPSYLRSAAAHNMLHLEDEKYNLSATENRVKLEFKKNDDSGFVDISGVNRSYQNFEIHRQLKYKENINFPSLECSDFFVKKSEHIDLSSRKGILNFHLGDGVEITSFFSKASNSLQYELTHPASSRTLFLSIFKIDQYNHIEVNESISGLGFMEKIKTKVISINLSELVECEWSLNVK